jgi:AraC-like DNA-binding protein
MVYCDFCITKVPLRNELGVAGMTIIVAGMTTTQGYPMNYARVSTNCSRPGPSARQNAPRVYCLSCLPLYLGFSVAEFLSQCHFTVEAICNKLGVGRRTFERRFRECTGNSVQEYVQRVKVEFAKKHLEAGHKTVNEIIYETGYSDIDAFRKVFKKLTDLSPVDYRRKYSA